MASSIGNKKLSAIIVDDELHGRENLKKIIEAYCPELTILDLADSVIKAKELVNVFNPDVVFLDINMPVLDGFDFLREYDQRNFMVVFVSAHEQFGIDAVKAGAVDYNILHDGCKPGSKGYKMAELAKRRYGHGQHKVPKASI